MIVTPIEIKAPGAMGHGQIISPDISAAEIEIDEAAHFVAQHQHIVREQVRMNDCVGQGGRPIGIDVSQLLGDTTRKARSNFVEMRSARSEEHTSELQSLMRISYAVFCLKKKTKKQTKDDHNNK